MLILVPATFSQLKMRRKTYFHVSFYFLSTDNNLRHKFRIISYFQFQPPIRPWGALGGRHGAFHLDCGAFTGLLRVCVALHIAAFPTPLAPLGLGPWDLITQPPEARETRRGCGMWEMWDNGVCAPGLCVCVCVALSFYGLIPPSPCWGVLLTSSLGSEGYTQQSEQIKRRQCWKRSHGLAQGLRWTFPTHVYTHTYAENHLNNSLSSVY